MLQALQRAIRQFCLDTEIWSETLDSIDLVEDKKAYSISSTWEAEIRRIKELRINTEDNISEGNDGVVKDPSLYKFVPPDALDLTNDLKPAEDVTDGLEVEIWIIPRITATTVDPTLLENWMEPVMGHALAFLMNMRRKKWSNPERAAYYNLQYAKGRVKAKSEKVRENRVENPGLSA